MRPSHHDLACRCEVGRKTTNSAEGSPLRIRQPENASVVLRPEMADLAQEQLRVLLLDTKNRLISQHLVYQGSIATIAIRPAEVFREAVRANALKVIVAHNHPSDDLKPSPEDANVTRQLLETGKILEIGVLDHLIISRDSVISLRSRGLPKG